MRDPIDNCAAGDRPNVYGQPSFVIRQKMDLLHDLGQLHDGICSALVLPARVRPMPLHLDIEGGPALPRDDERKVIASSPIRLEDEAGASALRQMITTDLAKVAREDFLTRVEEQDPVRLWEDQSTMFMERPKDQIH